MRPKEPKPDISPNRPLSDGERLSYLAGHFQFGQTVQELADEHKRSVKHVESELRRAAGDYPAWVKHFKKRGEKSGRTSKG